MSDGQRHCNTAYHTLTGMWWMVSGTGSLSFGSTTRTSLPPSPPTSTSGRLRGRGGVH